MSERRAWKAAVALAAVGIAVACGAQQQEVAPQAPVSVASAPSASEPSLPPLPAGHVWRYQLMRVMSPGLGAFLQRIDVKEVLVGGRFHGFRILELRAPGSFWQGVDLSPGDVVTEVNGRSIGHYDDAYAVWQSLVTASEIVVSYERGGKPRELRIQIHEDPADAGAASPAAPSR